jgi:glycosyltransferase involved in cell wall biosynthesis
LFNIANKLNKSNIIFDLIIIGDGDGFGYIQNLYKKFNFNNVFLFGHRNNPYPYIKNSDLFVCPSETEAYSTVLTEASIIGIPIISTDTGASSEIIQKYQSGLITKNTEDDLYQAIKIFLLNSFNVKKSNNSMKEADYHKTILKIEEFFVKIGESNVK